MGRRTGVEVSVNTSLNVAGPIVQTPQQALEALRRSKAMDGVLLLGADGWAYSAWHAVDAPPKDGGLRLRRWLQQWRRKPASRLDCRPQRRRRAAKEMLTDLVA